MNWTYLQYCRSLAINSCVNFRFCALLHQRPRSISSVHCSDRTNTVKDFNTFCSECNTGHSFPFTFGGCLCAFEVHGFCVSFCARTAAGRARLSKHMYILSVEWCRTTQEICSKADGRSRWPRAVLPGKTKMSTLFPTAFILLFLELVRSTHVWEMQLLVVKCIVVYMSEAPVVML